MLEEALAYNKANRDKHLDSLKEFTKIPSIGALPENRADTIRCAEVLAGELRTSGLNNVEVDYGQGIELPLVRAEWLGAPGKPTVLLYAHYDVQPVDPLNEWVTKPFEPTVRDGKIYARGISDDKGQLWILLKAVEAYLKTDGKLPVNVKFLFEGEEEFTSAHIKRYVASKPDFLKDVTSILVLDSVWFSRQLPAMQAGLRGIITADLLVRGTNSDLHSGRYGGAAPNAAQALCEILASLKTKTGRVRIKDFYRQVKKPSKQESDRWKKLPFDEEDFRKTIGAKCLIGDKRYPVLNRLWALPTFDICGMTSGFTGEGFKTIIPATARAKVSMRLAPGMDAHLTAELFARAVRNATPHCVTSEVHILLESPAVLVDISSQPVQMAVESYKQTIGGDVTYTRMGGSVPVCDAFSTMGIPLVITGFGMPDANHHAPNEWLEIDLFNIGLDAIARYLHILGQ
jgi:acetylornithine deacetylase/succinyl-diaminopimelate desuccinylase-like protein